MFLANFANNKTLHNSKYDTLIILKTTHNFVHNKQIIAFFKLLEIYTS